MDPASGLFPEGGAGSPFPQDLGTGAGGLVFPSPRTPPGPSPEFF